MGIRAPVRVLVLTFNRTLRGYINELAQDQVQRGSDLRLTISTFGHWSRDLTQANNLLDDSGRSLITGFGANISLRPDFLVEEVDYVLGRYLPGDLDTYLDSKREGRGTSPRVERALRERLLNEVIRPYQAAKEAANTRDWNDLAVDLATTLREEPYDIVIVDEGQDFSANQVRAIQNHLARDHTVTFILDAAQRIYNARFFTWKEVGMTIPSNATFRLSQNHRNTKQIAAFARQIIEKLDVTDDGTMPDLDSCAREGPLPKLLVGTFGKQMAYAVDYIKRFVDLKHDSVAFLHPKGGGWFGHVREQLDQAGLPYIDITREADWPAGEENIALSTLHSAKGLEFDHVIMLGLNAEVVQHNDETDGAFENVQRLFAMAVGRAKTSLIFGYKPQDAPSLVKLVKKSTYELVKC
jgi:superfamily I DNA/RNA helicase